MTLYIVIVSCTAAYMYQHMLAAVVLFMIWKQETLVMELRRRAIKRWIPCGDMDRRLKIPHSAKAECGFRTTPEECLYDSGPIGPSV